MPEFADLPLMYFKGAGAARAELLKKELSIQTVRDLVEYYPFRYVDRSRWYQVAELDAGLPFVQLKLVLQSKTFQGEGRARRLVAQAADATGVLELVWFRSVSHIDRLLKPGSKYVIFGKPNLFNGKINLVHPEVELLSEHKPPGNTSYQAVYSSTENLKRAGLDSRGIQRLIGQVLLHPEFLVPENLPVNVRTSAQVCGRYEAVMGIHLPAGQAALEAASRRIKFEEFFLIQIKMLRQKGLRYKRSKGQVFSRIGPRFNTFYERLPFQLTDAQKEVIREIRKDSQTGHQMNRLLQGDVGSGKTVVAVLCMLIAIDNGFQTCLMAPTEILARQHYETLTGFFADGLVQVALLTGSVGSAQRKKVLAGLEAGNTDILIGTHAVLEPSVVFGNLGLAVIDEQHRFGVQQRALLWAKGKLPPHILVMTATPIPRTLAMTLYGDLDISVIRALPQGRRPIVTHHYFESKRLRVFGFIEAQIALGRQIYVVYPLIEESATLDLLNLTKGFELLERSFPKPKYQISIVHGKMKSADKDFEMKRFLKKETQIMVATTVIEVGVNVPNASVMLVENAERFGLSTLHQLRGRVGRGNEQSYCILMTSDRLSAEGRTRMETMVRTSDGFEIAETDLALRGMGNLEGTQQSGVTDLKLADVSRDQSLLHLARHTVERLLGDDTELNLDENRILRNWLERQSQSGFNWDRIS